MAEDLERNDEEEPLPFWANLTTQVIRAGLLFVLAVYALGGAIYVVQNHGDLLGIEMEGLQAAHSVIVGQAAGAGGGGTVVAAANPFVVIIILSILILILSILVLLFWYVYGVKWVKRLIRKWARVWACPWTLSWKNFALCLLEGILVLVETFIWAALVVLTIWFIVQVNWPTLVFLLIPFLG